MAGWRHLVALAAAAAAFAADAAAVAAAARLLLVALGCLVLKYASIRLATAESKLAGHITADEQLTTALRGGRGARA